MGFRNHQGGDGPSVLETGLVAVGLMLVVSYRFFEPIWQVDGGLLALGLLTACAYLVARMAHFRSEPSGLRGALLLTLLVSQPILLALWALDLSVSRIVLAAELLLLFVAVVWTGAMRRSVLRVSVALGFAGLAAVPTMAGLLRPQGPDLDAGDPNKRYVFTSYEDVSVTMHEVIAHELQEGGALTPLPDDRVLLVAGSGAARLLDFSDGLHASTIDLQLPIDLAAYLALERREPQFYRVFDAVYDEGRLFVSYIHWNPDGGCYTLRLSEAEFDVSRVGPWVTRFESQPCVVRPYMVNTSGGRIAVLDPSHLLLSTGTFGLPPSDYDDWGVGSDYGKILRLDRDTWRHEVFTSGHRNPEGLLVAADRIWSTEHGPHGGDELNLIEAGSDYGWPRVSYGTEYGKKTLALGATPGDHAGFTAPMYSWLPSIGISNLIQVSSESFPAWQGDLLIGALSGLGNGHGLFRVRLLDGRVVSVEKILIESRVRDLLELPGGGGLILWDGRGIIRVMRPAGHVFSQCSGCHSVRNAQHGIGPDLYGVVGSPVARHEDYDYSPALRDYGGTWTPDRLHRYLENPPLEIPGTAMEHEGIRDPGERTEVIRFLREITAGRPN